MPSTAEIDAHSRLQAALVALGQFALKAPDLTAVMHEAVAAVKRTLEIDWCTILRSEPARGCLTVWAECGWPVGAAGSSDVPLDRSSHAGLAALAGQPVVVSEIERETRFVWTSELLERGIRSGAAVPFGSEDDPLGVVAAHSREPQRFAADEVYFLESVANVLGAAAQRADAERRTDRTWLLLEALGGNADPFAVVGRDWRVLYANQSFRERLAFVHSSDDAELDFRRLALWQRPEAKAAFLAAMEQGRADSFESNSPRDGQCFHVQVSPNDDGFSVYYHNVGELVRRNRELAARARQRAALADVAEAAVSSGCIEELLQRAARVVAATLDVEFSRIMELSEDGTSLTLRAGVGWQPELVGSFVMPFDPHTHVGYALLKNQPVASQDQRTETRLHNSPLLSSHGIVSGVSVVIGSTGKLRASLGVNSRRPRTFADDEIVFLESVASVLGTAMERQRVFAEIQQLNRRLFDVLNSISDSFYSVDQVWNLTYANEKCLQHLPFERAVGRNFFEVFPNMSEETETQLRRAHAAARPARFETFSQDRQRWLEVDAYPTSDGMLFHARDISERKEAGELVRSLNADLEQRVAERTAQLRAANGELESFSYSVSHDLRAPLRAIDGFSLALLEDFGDDLKPEAKGFLERVRSAASRMGRLIDDLLKLSQIARRELTRRSFDLSELACQVVAESRERDPQREVEVLVEPGMRATGDRDLLRIALENLIGNAWKFTRKTASARIEVGVLQAPAGDTFYVRDNGVGFDMSYADKLFGSFQRLHATEDFEGTGIGLATVQRIVQRHGGRVWAEAKVGAGATFYLTLEPSAARPVA